MMRETGCDGVVVGRGCLGRPWLFRDLADVFAGREPGTRPTSAVCRTSCSSTRACWPTGSARRTRMRAFRKHSAGTRRASAAARALRERLHARATLVDALDAILADDRPHASRSRPRRCASPRGKRGGRQRVVLPEGYLDDLDDETPPGVEAETADSEGRRRSRKVTARPLRQCSRGYAGSIPDIQAEDS